VKCARAWAGLVLLLPLAGVASGQTAPPINQDTLGMHNMSTNTGSSVNTTGSLGCTFCHAPHSGLGGVTPLWNQTLSQQSYVPYISTTDPQKGSAVPPILGKGSSLCLSCHDGTVAVGQTAVYGKVPTTGTLKSSDVLGTNLTGSHPFNLVLPIVDSPNLVASLAQNGATADTTGAVKLINGNIECTSCHDPHNQGIDIVAQNFLVRNSSNGQMCLACHDPTRVVTGQNNQLTGWIGSIHQVTTNQVTLGANVGLYPTVAANSCSSCHTEHNASTTATRLLRPATTPTTLGNIDAATQDCITCHNGGNYLTPSAPNVYGGEFATKPGSHVLPAGLNTHDAAEPAVLNTNRHATCVDCHSAHASNQMTTFGLPPSIRPPQNNAVGVSAVDGVTVLTPAVNQYETCFRCHGSSTGKQSMMIYGYMPRRLVSTGDPLNVRQEFSPSPISSHPVVQPSNSAFAQPSLLPYMLNQNGTASNRAMGNRLFCTDCHSSDDTREFGGTGPAGPHGSIYPHILERNYQFSQAATPGGTVTNTYPNPATSPQGPYAMCAKCHDLTNILSNASWAQHSLHISQYGFSCSVCHTAHGIAAPNGVVTGQRLINFDLNVVGPNGAAPISYNGTTCTLTCHNAAHNANGSVTASGSPSQSVPVRKN